VAAGAEVALAEALGVWRDKYPGVPAGGEVVPGRPARILVGLSARAGLVVIGRRLARRLDEAAHRVDLGSHRPSWEVTRA